MTPAEVHAAALAAVGLTECARIEIVTWDDGTLTVDIAEKRPVGQPFPRRRWNSGTVTPALDQMPRTFEAAIESLRFVEPVLEVAPNMVLRPPPGAAH